MRNGFWDGPLPALFVSIVLALALAASWGTVASWGT